MKHDIVNGKFLLWKYCICTLDGRLVPSETWTGAVKHNKSSTLCGTFYIMLQIVLMVYFLLRSHFLCVSYSNLLQNRSR